MREVFVDTGAFYAALNRKDEHHHEAVQLFMRAVEEEWQLFTSNFIVAETHALILTRLGRDLATDWLRASLFY
jgi:predicted nucleic acid-binding protein